MATITNNDLMQQLMSIEKLNEEKFVKLNKFLISRCIHFEEQNNILKSESQVLRKKFENLLKKYDGICEQLSVTKAEIELQVITNKDKGVAVMESELIEPFTASEINKNNTNINQFKSTLTDICDDVCLVKKEINAINQNIMCNDVVITGLFEEQNENLYDKVERVLTHYNIKLKKDDIKKIYRLKNKTCGKNSPVLMVLKENTVKCHILEMQKKYGPALLQAIYENLPKTDVRKVFFKHRLTKENLLILRESRKFGRENGYEFIWTSSNASILVKKSSESRTLVIGSLKDLQKLK